MLSGNLLAIHLSDDSRLFACGEAESIEVQLFALMKADKRQDIAGG